MVEIVVVVVIVGVLTAVAAGPMIGSWTTAKLRTSARDVYLTADYARAYAITRQSLCRLVLDAQGGFVLEYQPDPLADPERFEPVQADLQRRMRLREGVGFEVIDIQPRSATASGDGQQGRAIIFYPTGEADAALIVIADDYHAWTVRIAGSTGRAQLTEGRDTQMLNDRIDLDR